MTATALARRLERLEGRRTPPSRWDALDPILAELSTSELIHLIRRTDAVRERRRPTPEQEAAYGRVQDRLALVGIVLP